MSNKQATAQVFYRVVYSFAGVKWGRSTSAFTVFADANRAAMKVAAEGKNARVYAFGRDPFAGDLVAEYEISNGRALCVPVV